MSEHGSEEFPETEWRRVEESKDSSPLISRRAQEELFQVYWGPLYGYARMTGHSEEDAKDLVQGYFGKLASKNGLKTVDRKIGKFRTFLLRGFINFTCDEWRKGQAIKRGGGTVVLSFGEAEEFVAVAESSELTPEEAYQRNWARTVLNNSALRMKQEYTRLGKESRYDILAPFALSEDVDCALIAQHLRIDEESVRKALKRFRKDYKKYIKLEISDTIAPDGDISEELESLFMAFSKR